MAPAPKLDQFLYCLSSLLLRRIFRGFTQCSPLRSSIDTDSEISSSSDLDTAYTEPNETLADRIIALRDIVPPRARAQIASATSSIYNLTGSAITYGGKGLWVLATSAFLLGIPYALALGQEQEIVEEEKRQGMMTEGASGLLQPGEAAVEVRQSL
jgi:import receptor subunit TOM22